MNLLKERSLWNYLSTIKLSSSEYGWNLCAWIKTKNIINWGENVFDHFYEAILENQEMRIKDNDIIIITSKIVSMEQNAYKIINNVVPSEIAINLGKNIIWIQKLLK